VQQVADSVRHAIREVFARSEYAWRAPQRHWLTDLWRRFLDWLQDVDRHHPVAMQLLLWSAIAVLAVILVHWGYVAFRIYRSTVQAGSATAAGPLPAIVDARTHLVQAEALAREGRYAEALAHRFMHLVLELERRDAVKVHPSKTPAEYAREARLGADGRATLAGLVARLYHHVFGAEPCDERAYGEFSAAAQGLL
jgi:hypothetical protein